MKDLPYYYHLSPSQLQHLSFRVNIRRNGGAIQSKDIGWQEQISLEQDADDLDHVAIFTLTTKDGGVAILPDASKYQGRRALAERINRDREDEEMVIMARVDNHDETICVLKVYLSGMVSACPALCEEEEFSNTHSFITPDQEEFDYSIEMMIDQEDDVEGGGILLNSWIYEEKRRQLFNKEVDVAEHAFDYQAHVEIVSASGFTQPNILFSAPFGSDLIIRYKIVKPGEYGGKDNDVLTGTTNKFQSYAVLATSIQFLVPFFVSFICIGFAALYSLGKSIGSDISTAALLSFIPLGLLCQFIVFGRVKLHHINHQFSLLFSKSRGSNDHPAAISQQSAMMEMHAYFHHNFGMISLAGSATVALPCEPGAHDLTLPFVIPIACSGINERTCRMQSYYLGTCMSDVRPCEPSPTTRRILSKAGLITEGSGSITLRVNVMKNYFNGAYNDNNNNSSDEQAYSSQHRTTVQETVDEVLSRVRRNKRIRMSRMVPPSSIDNPGRRNVTRGRNSRRSYRDVATNEEEETKQYLLSLSII